MSTSLVPMEATPITGDYLPPVDPKAVEQAMLIGDLSQMTDEQRIAYYVATCRSLNLNPLTKPFQALKDDDGKLRLYPDKGCAEQLRKRDKVSTKVLGREILDGLYIVTVQARTPDGREEEAQGIVPLVKAKGRWEDYEYRGQPRRRFKAEIDAEGQEVLVPLSPNERASAMKRAETQAKRRATLAICGLGMPDYEGDPDSPSHPQRLALTSQPLHATIADLTDFADPTIPQHAQEGPQQPAGAMPTPAPVSNEGTTARRRRNDPGSFQGQPASAKGAAAVQEGQDAPPPAQDEAEVVPTPAQLVGDPGAAAGHTYTVDPETGQLLDGEGKPLPNLMQQEEEEDEPGLFGGGNETRTSGMAE